MQQIIKNQIAMETLGGKLALACKPGCVIYLIGELGAGKTTLVRGFLRSLGYQGHIKSPTYTIVEPYQLNNYQIFHFDLYRLSDPEELEYLGIHDYFTENAICLIEWPERGRGVLPSADIICQLHYHEKGRLVEMQPTSQLGRSIVKKLV